MIYNYSYIYNHNHNHKHNYNNNLYLINIVMFRISSMKSGKYIGLLLHNLCDRQNNIFLEVMRNYITHNKCIKLYIVVS